GRPGAYPGEDLRGAAGARAPGGRSDRLRRRLPRRPDLRHREGLRLADHRPHGQPDGGAEGRAPGHPEPALRLRRVQRALPPAVRLQPRVRRPAPPGRRPAPPSPRARPARAFAFSLPPAGLPPRAPPWPPAPARPADRAGARPGGGPGPAAPASTAAAPGPRR